MRYSIMMGPLSQWWQLAQIYKHSKLKQRCDENLNPCLHMPASYLISWPTVTCLIKNDWGSLPNLSFNLVTRRVLYHEAWSMWTGGQKQRIELRQTFIARGGFVCVFSHGSIMMLCAVCKDADPLVSMWPMGFWAISVLFSLPTDMPIDICSVWVVWTTLTELCWSYFFRNLDLFWGRVCTLSQYQWWSNNIKWQFPLLLYIYFCFEGIREYGEIQSTGDGSF